MLFRGHSLIMIKSDWMKFYPKIAKWITHTIKDKKVTSSNSSLNLWTDRKYAIESIPVKSIVFLEAKTLKDITSHSLKLEKSVFTIAYPIWSQCLTIPMLPSILEPSGLVRNLPLPYTDKEKPYNITN